MKEAVPLCKVNREDAETIQTTATLNSISVYNWEHVEPDEES